MKLSYPKAVSLPLWKKGAFTLGLVGVAVGLAHAAGAAAPAVSAPAASAAPTPTAMTASPTAAPSATGVPSVVSTTCMACHGMQGISAPDSMFPNLAGQWRPYLVKQINDFRTHKRADPMAPIMLPMVATLTSAQIQRVTTYFAAQKPNPGKVYDPQLVAEGKKIFEGGIAKAQVPACMACHGPTGLGVPPLFPRLAGQRRTYVIDQLTYFKNGTRANDPHAIMRYIASHLSSQQMTALAAYVRSL